MSKRSRHHLRPRSRGGCDCPENLVGLPDYLHRGWHNLFGNAYGEEVIDLLNQLEDVFGDVSISEMRKRVRKEWVR